MLCYGSQCWHCLDQECIHHHLKKIFEIFCKVLKFFVKYWLFLNFLNFLPDLDWPASPLQISSFPSFDDFCIVLKAIRLFTSGTSTRGEDLENKYLENEGNRIEENLLKIENTAGCFIIWLLKVRQFRKDFLVSSDSSKKRMNKFVFSTVRQKKWICSFVFWKNPRIPKDLSKLSDL